MNQISLAEYCQQIEAAIQEGRYQEAVAHGRHILEQYPKYAGAYWLLGKAMLESGRDDHATDMFQRVLSINPDHMLAWVGMSEIAQRQDDLEDAVWYMQRAFELATDNEMVAEELRRLYGRLRGAEPDHLQLTESALAKLHLRGDHLTLAISELRRLIEEHPDRLDLKVSLIEALWRDGQRLQASEVCQEVLDEQFYNLKANLILGEIWCSSGRTAEGEPYLERAEALDPQNDMAQELFGSASPLPPSDPKITPLDYDEAQRERPMDWAIELEEVVPTQEVTDEDREAVHAAEEALEIEAEEPSDVETELPAWLREPDEEPAAEPAAEIPDEPEIPAEPEGARSVEYGDLEISPEPERAPPIEPAEPGQQLGEETMPERPIEEPVYDEEMPEGEEPVDWLSELEGEETAPDRESDLQPAEIPDWLADFESQADEDFEWEEGELPEEAEPVTAEPEEAEPERAEIPEWLRDLAPAAPEPSRAGTPDDLAAIFDQEVPREDLIAEGLEAAEPEMEEPPTEAFELDEVGDEEVGALEPEPQELETVEEIPEELEEILEPAASLEDADLPSRDDALAWLAQLAEGGDELPAQPSTEEEDLLTEILGRPESPAEKEPSPAPVDTAEIEDEVAVEEEEPFGWTAFDDGEMAEPEPEEMAPSAPAAPTAEEEEVEVEAPEPEAPEVEPSEVPAFVEEEAPTEPPALEEEVPGEEVPEPTPAIAEEEIEAEEPSPADLEPPEVPAFVEEAPPTEPPALEEEEAPVQEVPEPTPPMAEEEEAEAEAPAAPEIEPLEVAPPAEEAPPAEPLPFEEEAPVSEVPEPTPPTAEEEEEEVEAEAPAAPEIEPPELTPIAEEAPPTEPIPFEKEAPVQEVAEPVAPKAEVEEMEAEQPAAPEVEPPEVAPISEEAPPTEPVPFEEEAPVSEVPEPAPPIAEEEFDAEEPAAPEAPSLEEAMEEAPTEDLERFIEDRRAYTAKHAEDHGAQLELGRVLWQADRLRDAVEAYEVLIERSELLDEVIADLETYADQWPDASLKQALGDAYMKADRLDDALAMYRQALASL